MLETNTVSQRILTSLIYFRLCFTIANRPCEACKRKHYKDMEELSFIPSRLKWAKHILKYLHRYTSWRETHVKVRSLYKTCPKKYMFWPEFIVQLWTLFPSRKSSPSLNRTSPKCPPPLQLKRYIFVSRVIHL